MVDQPSDEELVGRYQAGDEMAFNVLYRRFAPRLARRARQQLDSTDAESVAHSTLLNAARRFDAHLGTRFEVFAWSICEMERIDAIRKRSTHKARMHQEALLAGADDALGRVEAQQWGPEDQVLPYDGPVAIVGAIYSRIDSYCGEDRRRRDIHRATFQRMLTNEFPTDGIPFETAKRMADRLKCRPDEVTRAESRIRRFALDVIGAARSDE